jgi:PleD family two-component response regulator
MIVAEPRILIAGEQLSDAELVRRLLSDEFSRVVLSTDPQRAVSDFESQKPDVLVLAFNTIEKAEAYYLGVHRLGRTAHEALHRTVVLCNKDELRKVYELCRRRYFDDYVLFWPLGHDVTRLLMAVQHCWQALSATPGDVTGTGIPPAPEQRLPRVLAVDDDPFQHKLLRRILADEPVELMLAVSSAEAMALISEQRPDLILMDLDLPDVDGLETTRRLKASERLSAIPVIMVTGHGDRSTVVDSLNAGAVDFVVKPLDKSVLLAKIQKALRSE